MYNTRIAPSPTGKVHIGLVRTAYFNYLASKSTGGKFILRIDDTDLTRSKQEYVDEIIKTMEWLTLNPDLIIKQSSRFDIYKEFAEKLIEKSLAKVENQSIVLDIGNISTFPKYWTDKLSGNIKISEDDISNCDGSVIIKSNGTPSYNFASVIDDIQYEINLVIRGVDHITNTSKQAIIYHILNEKLPEYCHIGLIGKNGKPFSKRDGEFNIDQYRNYDVDAILNTVARLGWSPTKDDKSTSLLKKEDMLRMFLTEGKMKNSFANFDQNKLDSYNRKYLARK